MADPLAGLASCHLSQGRRVPGATTRRCAVRRAICIGSLARFVQMRCGAAILPWSTLAKEDICGVHRRVHAFGGGAGIDCVLDAQHQAMFAGCATAGWTVHSDRGAQFLAM